MLFCASMMHLLTQIFTDLAGLRRFDFIKLYNLTVKNCMICVYLPIRARLCGKNNYGESTIELSIKTLNHQIVSQ